MKTKRGFTGQVFKAEDESLDVVGDNSSEEPEKDEIFQIQLELEEQKRLYRELVTKQEKERQQYQKKKSKNSILNARSQAKRCLLENPKLKN